MNAVARHAVVFLAVSGCAADDIDAPSEFDPAVECGPIVGISIDESRTCARTSSGHVRCWGEIFSYGEQEFGDDEPAWEAPWLDGDFATLSVGRDACGLTLDGDLGCRDPAGTFFTNFVGSPIVTNILEFGTTVTQVSIGVTNGCVLLIDGSVRCWGAHFAVGIATDETIGDDEPPVSVGLPSPAQSISVGTNVGCAVLEAGELACWGIGDACTAEGLSCGTLGVPGVEEAPTPLLVELPGPATAVSVGYFNVCVRLGEDSFTCWGEDLLTGRGGVGGHIGDDETPAALEPLTFNQPIEALEVGSGGSCILLLDGSVTCWGTATIADPIDPNGEFVLDPFAVDPIPLPEPATGIAVGRASACAVGVSGVAYCWGSPTNGALGYGHENVIGYDPTITEVQPVPVLDPRCDE